VGLSLVRCPFCDRRYNVTGIPSGTKVLCTSCRAILTVPGARFVAPESFWRRLVPRSSIAQASAAILGGLILAAGGLLAVRSTQAVPDEMVVGNPKSGPSSANSDRRDAAPLLFLTPDQQKEFGDRDRFAIHTKGRMDPFVLVVEKHEKIILPRILEHYEALLPKLLNTFMTDFGKPLGLGEIRERLLIVLFTRRESWEAWWYRISGRPPKDVVSGVYSKLDKRVSILFEAERGLQAASPKEVLLHEAVHQIIDYYYRERVKDPRPAAWWFQEGMGNYFEGYYESPGGETILQPSAATSRLPMARELVTTRRENFVVLTKLLTWTVDDIWVFIGQGDQNSQDRDRQMEVINYAYAQSWALVHFLIHGGNGMYRPFFLDYFRSELEGRGGWDEFDRLLKQHHEGLDLPELQNRFVKYVEDLK
jgi:hypothetical protein